MPNKSTAYGRAILKGSAVHITHSAWFCLLKMSFYFYVRKFTSLANRHEVKNNHLSWIVDIKHKGNTIFDRIFETEKLMEALKLIKQGNIPFPISYKIAQDIKAIPSSYLTYYYHEKEIVDYQNSLETTRATKLIEKNKEVFELYKNLCFENWPNYLNNIRGALMLGVTVAEFILDRLGLVKNKTHTVCIRNKGLLPWLNNDAVVEASVRIDGFGSIVPQSLTAKICDHIKDLTMRVSEYERLVIQSALTLIR